VPMGEGKKDNPVSPLREMQTLTRKPQQLRYPQSLMRNLTKNGTTHRKRHLRHRHNRVPKVHHQAALCHTPNPHFHRAIMASMLQAENTAPRITRLACVSNGNKWETVLLAIAAILPTVSMSFEVLLRPVWTHVKDGTDKLPINSKSIPGPHP